MQKIIFNKKIDFAATCFLLALGFAIAILFKLKPLSGAIFYLLAPSLYLILREKKNFWKIFWGVAVFGFIVGFAFDFAQTLNKS